MKAVRAQLERVTHTCFQVTGYEPYVALCERLNGLAPGGGAHKTLLMTTGAEAIENAVKIARVATGRAAVISFSGGFHGRTLMALALTGKIDPYKLGFGPYPAEVYHAPFPNPLHGVSVEDSFTALGQIFKCDVAADRVAAIIVEPVQGEGGFYVAPKDFILRLRELCDRHGILLIADEIQSGAGRTGRMFAMEHYGVAADLYTLAKSIAGGFPLSAVVGRAEVMDACGPGGLGGTYAGNPVACAAAIASFDLLCRDECQQSIQHIAAAHTRFIKDNLSNAVLKNLRSAGTILAMDFKTSEPTSYFHSLRDKLYTIFLEKGIILRPLGNTVYVMPPYCISKDELQYVHDTIEGCGDNLN